MDLALNTHSAQSDPLLVIGQLIWISIWRENAGKSRSRLVANWRGTKRRSIQPQKASGKRVELFDSNTIEVHSNELLGLFEISSQRLIKSAVLLW